MLIPIETMYKIIEEIEDYYDTLLLEDALEDKEGAITDEELDRLLEETT